MILPSTFFKMTKKSSYLSILIWTFWIYPLFLFLLLQFAKILYLHFHFMADNGRERKPGQWHHFFELSISNLLLSCKPDWTRNIKMKKEKKTWKWSRPFSGHLQLALVLVTRLSTACARLQSTNLIPQFLQICIQSLHFILQLLQDCGFNFWLSKCTINLTSFFRACESSIRLSAACSCWRESWRSANCSASCSKSSFAFNFISDNWRTLFLLFINIWFNAGWNMKTWKHAQR